MKSILCIQKQEYDVMLLTYYLFTSKHTMITPLAAECPVILSKLSLV